MTNDKSKLPTDLNPQKIPQHIAVIMDGNDGQPVEDYRASLDIAKEQKHSKNYCVAAKIGESKR